MWGVAVNCPRDTLGSLVVLNRNNLFVFDYTDGTKIIIAKEGRLINAFNDDGIIKPTTKVLNDCLDVLKLYCMGGPF